VKSMLHDQPEPTAPRTHPARGSPFAAGGASAQNQNKKSAKAAAPQARVFMAINEGGARMPMQARRCSATRS